VVALDKSPEMLRVARTRLQHLPAGRVELVQGDFAQLPFAPGSFDTVLFHQVLHYAIAPEAVLAEAARVTAPGGRVAIVDFAAHDREELRTAHAHARLGFSDAQVEKLLLDAGFKPDGERALPGHELIVKVWTGVRSARPGCSGRQRHPYPARTCPHRAEGHVMTTSYDQLREARTALDTPLFAGLPGDIRVSFEFFRPRPTR
jgi:SAM-dependent methyltransferase